MGLPRRGLTITNHCFWHPDTETGLSCGQCSKSMCTSCLVQAPVGIRCRDCGKAVPLPTHDVQKGYYARALGMGIAAAVGGSVFWILASTFLGAIPYVSWLIPVGIGYGAGEIISLSVNRKRSTGLAYIAAGAVIAAFLISSQVVAGSGIFGLLFLVVGVLIAVQRVR